MAAGKLIGIAWKTASHGSMIRAEKASIRLQTGLEDDHRGKPGKRQITVLAKEAFEKACKTNKLIPDWTMRRANLLIEGIQLEQSTGKMLRIGDVLLEITGETKPCYRMDEQQNGLQEALKPEWRGGVTCRVLEAGEIAVGDAVCFA
jgi:MOSC domain-containing protein YiiM